MQTKGNNSIWSNSSTTRQPLHQAVENFSRSTQQSQRVVFLEGEPGSGKTVQLVNLVREMCKSKDSERIPLYISLNRYQHTVKSASQFKTFIKDTVGIGEV